jgi:hypothetical protein
LPAALPQPIPASAVQRFGNFVRDGYAKSDGLGRSLGYGQGLLADRWWMWVDLQLAILPPQIIQAPKDVFAASRMPRGLSAVETDDVIRQSGVELHALLKRISVRSRP